MRLGIVGDLIAHAGLQHELPAVLQLGVQFAFEAEQYVAF